MKKLWLLLAVPVLIILGTVAYASIPSSDGVIHGCYRTTNGDLRVIDSEDTCDTDETALNWDQSSLVRGHEVVEETHNLPAGQVVSLFPECPVGKKAVSGGYSTGHDHLIKVYASVPHPDGTWWTTRFVSNETSNTRTVWAYAVCVLAE